MKNLPGTQIKGMDAKELRQFLEEQGFKFPNSIEFAGKFSCEAQSVDGYILSSDNSLGFHCGGTHPQKVKLLESIL